MYSPYQKNEAPAEADRANADSGVRRGPGYPFGLRSDEIPVTERIARVADAFDAIASARVCRPARGPAEAVRELQRGGGTVVDSESVKALIAALSLATTAPEVALQELIGRRAA